MKKKRHDRLPQGCTSRRSPATVVARSRRASCRRRTSSDTRWMREVARCAVRLPKTRAYPTSLLLEAKVDHCTHPGNDSAHPTKSCLPTRCGSVILCSPRVHRIYQSFLGPTTSTTLDSLGVLCRGLATFACSWRFHHLEPDKSLLRPSPFFVFCFAFFFRVQEGAEEVTPEMEQQGKKAKLNKDQTQMRITKLKVTHQMQPEPFARLGRRWKCR